MEGKDGLNNLLMVYGPQYQYNKHRVRLSNTYLIGCSCPSHSLATWWHIIYKILHAYINYVTKYSGQAVVVFDGDKAGASTKDSTSHNRAGCEGRKVMLNLSMKLQLKMNNFLSNKYNKQWFLGLLGMPPWLWNTIFHWQWKSQTPVKQ